MATSASAITPPEGYTLEQPQGSAPTPPRGYALEGQPPATQPSGLTDVLGRPANVPPQAPPPQGPTIGATPRGVMTVPFARALMNAVDKLRDAQNFTQEGKEEHPVQAKLGDLANQIEGFLFGNETHGEAAIGTGKYGILTNPVTGSLLPGGEGAPAAAEAISGGVNALKSGAAAVKEALSGGGEAADAANAATHVFDPATKKISPIQKITQAISPEAASQPGAQATLRGAAGAGDSGGVRTLLDEPIAAVSKTERATYDTLNKASKTDLKTLYEYSEEVQDALDDPTNIAQKTSLQAELKTTQDQIAQGEANVKEALGDNAQDLLDKARGITRERYAKEALKQKLFNNESIVEGDVRFHEPETINVKAAIRQAQNLDKPSRYAPEGSPTRLRQALGDKGANDLLQGLYQAQKAGSKVLTRNKVLTILGASGGAVGGIFGFLKH